MSDKEIVWLVILVAVMYSCIYLFARHKLIKPIGDFCLSMTVLLVSALLGEMLLPGANHAPGLGFLIVFIGVPLGSIVFVVKWVIYGIKHKKRFFA